jgi:hypothetical protein
VNEHAERFDRTGMRIGNTMTDPNWIEEQRQQIRNSGLIERLIEFVQADPEMADTLISPSQARIGLQLLRKVLPDLQSIAVALSDFDQRPERELSREEITSRIQDLHEQSGEEGRA